MLKMVHESINQTLCQQNEARVCVEDRGIAKPDCCFTLDKDLSTVVGIWCILNAAVGLSGNLLTLLAIPYATHRKKFGFQRSWGSTSIFVLNLAFADFLYCMINLPLNSLQYLSQDWPLGYNLCYASAAFRYFNAFADWMSLACISLIRCLSVIKSNWSKKLSSGKNGIVFILFIWLYAVCMVSPLLTKSLGSFGYNYLAGKCDIIKVDGYNTDPHVTLLVIGFSIPCLIILASYSIIWWFVKSSSSSIKNSGCTENRRQPNKRDMKMTWTLFLVCFCYFLFVMPITLVHIIDTDPDTTTRKSIHLACFCVYWMQYSLNFIIYAAINEQYKKAYMSFLRDFNPFTLCCCFAKSQTRFYIDTKCSHKNVKDANNKLRVNSSIQL